MANLRTLSRALLLSCSMVVWPAVAHAQEVRKGVIVKVDAEADSNPFLTYAGSNNGSNSTDWVGAGTVEVRPWISSKSETESFDLAAFARGRVFTSRYKLDDSYGANLNVASRTSERTTISGRVGISSTNSRNRYDYVGQLPAALTPGAGPGTGAVDPTTPAPAPDPSISLPGDDITLLGLGGRSTSIDASAQGTTLLSEVSSLSANVGYQKLIVSGQSTNSFGNTDYSSALAGMSYSRQLSSRTSVGLRANGQFTRYEGNYPASTTLALYATVDSQLSEFWRLSASAGVSATHSQANTIFPSFSNVTAAGSVSVCNQNAKRSLCVSYQRSQQPSALGRVRTNQSVSGSASVATSDRDRLSATALYSQSKSDVSGNTSYPSVELASFSSTFTHTFSKRLDGYVFGRADRTYGGLVNDKPSIAIGVGLTVRFGD